MKIKVLIVFVLLYSITALAQVVNVTNYGATPDNASNDDRAAIVSAINACRSLSSPILFFPKGTYHLVSDNAYDTYFHITNINNLTIDGAGSTLLIQGTRYNRHIFNFENCKILSVKDLNIDYEDLPFSQGEVIAAGSNYMDVQLFPDFNPEGKQITNYAPYDNITGQQIFDNETFSQSNWQWLNRNNNIIRINDNNRNYYAGMFILMRHAQYDGYSFIVTTGCENVVFNGVTVFVAPGYPFYVSNGAKNISYLNCSIKKRQDNFWATSTVDGAHLLDARGDIVFDNCYFENMCDDGINLHGYFWNVNQRIDDKTLRVQSAASFHTGIGYNSGDQVEFLNDNQEVVGVNVITNITNMSGNLMTLTFQDNVPSGTNYKLSNVSVLGSLTVKNTTIKKNRARGVLVSTSKVLIENCTFERNMMSAILFEVSNYWNESTPSRNAVIKNNTFDDVNFFRTNKDVGIIDINAGQATSCAVFNDISITGNTFKNSHVPAIRAKFVEGLVVDNNTIENVTNNGNLILYGNCSYYSISNNLGATNQDLGANCTKNMESNYIAVNPKNVLLSLNKTLRLTATVFPLAQVEWTSNNAAVATVDSNGLVTAIAEGTTLITVSSVDGGISATCTITVLNTDIQVPEGILSITGPTDLLQGERISVNVAYSSNQTRDIIVYLQENGVDLNNDGYAYSAQAAARFTVNAGVKTVPIELTVNIDAPLSNNYRFTTFLTATTGEWLERVGQFTIIPNVSVLETLSISMSDEKTYSIHPNPTHDFIQVNISNVNFENVRFKLYNTLGVLVLADTVDLKNGKWEIDVRRLSNCVHVLEITVDDKTIYHKFVKN